MHYQSFATTEVLMQTSKSIDIDDQVSSLEKQKESLLTDIKETENNLKLVKDFTFFPEDLKVLQLSSASSYFGSIETEKFSDFKKALDEYQKDVFLFFKEKKKVTQLVLVVFSSLASQTFSTIIQSHNVKIEAVPSLNGRPDDIIKSQKVILDELSQKLKQIDPDCADIAKP